MCNLKISTLKHEANNIHTYIHTFIQRTIRMDPSTTSTSSQKNCYQKYVTIYGWTDVSTYIYVHKYEIKLTEFGEKKKHLQQM